MHNQWLIPEADDDDGQGESEKEEIREKLKICNMLSLLVLGK